MDPKVTVSVVFVATMFMYILDSTVVNVALPTLRGDFRTSTASVSSVVTGYLVTLAVAMPTAAWLGDRYGGKRVLLAALALFTGASALCGLAGSLPELIAFRGLQGIAAGISLPVGSAMLFRTFAPAERIRATRILMVPTLIAPALGPVLGGLLVGELSWRWIFYVNVPVGVAALVFGLLWLAPRREADPGPFDLRGFLLACTGFPLAMYALTDGAAYGWGSPPILAAGLAALVLLIAFVVVSVRAPAPVLRLALLASRGFRVANLVMVAGGAAFLETLFLVPLFLQNGLGFTPLHSGLCTFTEALGGIAGIQISSRLFPRVGPRPLMAGGLAAAAVFVAAMAFVGQAAATWATPALMLFTGAGFAFAMAPSQATSLAVISRAETAQATTLTTVLRQAGSAVGVALVATCLAAMHPVRPDLNAYHVCFGIAAVVMVAGACIGLRVRKSDALPAMMSQVEAVAALPISIASRLLWPNAPFRPHNDGMTGSIVAPEAAPWAEAAAAPSPAPAAAVRTAPAVESAVAPLLTVSNLSARFGPVQALRGVDLMVRPGELVALAGENGAGKTTLVRCIAGDVAPASGEIHLAGRRVHADPAAAAKHGIAVVWQDLALCDNLDIAANIMLGRESRRLLWSETRLHQVASTLLADLKIPLTDTTRSVRTLSGGQRQLVAVARAMGRKPRLIALDEPTAALGVIESRQVEDLIMGLREQGTTILLACHDIDQMFRLADRIVVLRQGQIVADLRTADTHPEDVVALLSGQQVDSSARRQLTRLHGLTDRLVRADPSNSLSLILSALGAALGTELLCIHLANGRTLHCAASLGFTQGQLEPWTKIPFGPAGGPVGMAAADERPVIADNVRAWRTFRELAKSTKVASSWSVPVRGPGGLSGLSGVITVFRAEHSAPRRDELDLVTVYAGYAASAIERDRLLEQVTTRNRVLETIREMLETLAGPVPVADGLDIALQSLRRGLQAEEVALLTNPADGPPSWRGFAGPRGVDPEEATQSLTGMATDALANTSMDGVARELRTSRRRRARAVVFAAAGGRSVLLASWRRVPPTKEETTLMEDAAHSLRLALEREEAASAHQEAAALRRSRELQRGFLSRLSHELRTPLTAIRGYASSLMQKDVTWDGDSQQRFLDRIAAESSRLGRLVDDLLDFSAIESGIMRLQPDWCDIRLVIDAAVACLPPVSAKRVTTACAPDLPVVWADHDRMEQVLVNLLTNAFAHNPPGTTVHVAAAQRQSEVVISVRDDGTGMAPPGSRSRSAGAGLGLSIARGIVQAHGGTMELSPVTKGTCFSVHLAIEGAGRDD